MTAKKGRRAAAGTIAAEQDALEQALAGWPDPPASTPLRVDELRFWRSIMVCRLPASWHEADLVNAAQLARAYAEIERQRRRLFREGDMVGDPPRLNTRHGLIERLQRTAMSLTRILQLHAVARVGGQKGDQAGEKGEAAKAAAAVAKAGAPAHVTAGGFDPDSVLAQPRRLQ